MLLKTKKKSCTIMCCQRSCTIMCCQSGVTLIWPPLGLTEAVFNPKNGDWDTMKWEVCDWY